METRINPMLNEVGSKWAKYIISSKKAITDSALPKAVQELVKIRASQINGCGGCLDMHTKDAAAAGESMVRINLVGAWRETTVYTDAERAALELTEQGTRLADSSGVTDEAWANAAKHFDEGPADGPGGPDLRDQRLQPAERHHSDARRRLPARTVRLTRTFAAPQTLRQGQDS
jgi:AhpD family alkylhydroperoxidase